MNRIKSLFISTIIFLIPAHLVIAQEQKEDLAQQAANLITDNGDYMRGLPMTDGPLKVLISFQVINITDVNEKAETIDLEGAIYLVWMDIRQAYDPVALGMPQGDEGICYYYVVLK